MLLHVVMNAHKLAVMQRLTKHDINNRTTFEKVTYVNIISDILKLGILQQP